MRKSNWTPSIVPDDRAPTVYLVADDFGKIGLAWREADYEATDLETVIQGPNPEVARDHHVSALAKRAG